MEQHITNLILEMIENTEIVHDIQDKTSIKDYAIDLRKQVPDLVTKIMNLMEYNKK